MLPREISRKVDLLVIKKHANKSGCCWDGLVPVAPRNKTRFGLDDARIVSLSNGER